MEPCHCLASHAVRTAAWHCCALVVTLGATAAQAQTVSRIAVSGNVSPRCWAAGTATVPVRVPDESGFDTAAQVRCSVTLPQLTMQVRRVDAQEDAVEAALSRQKVTHLGPAVSASARIFDPRATIEIVVSPKL